MWVVAKILKSPCSQFKNTQYCICGYIGNAPPPPLLPTKIYYQMPYLFVFIGKTYASIIEALKLNFTTRPTKSITHILPLFELRLI